MQPYKIFVAAPDDELPGILLSCIRRDASLMLCGHCASAGDAVRQAGLAAPDAVALDLRLAGDGYERMIADLRRTGRAAVVAMGPATGVALRAMDAGACDFIHMPVAGSESDCSMFAVDAAERLKVAVLGRNAPGLGAGTHFRAVRLFAVAAAQGGPVQAACVLSGLPEGGPPVIILQRNPHLYGGDIAFLLSGMTGRSVVDGADGMLLSAGDAVVIDGSRTVGIEVSGADIRLRLGAPGDPGDTADALFRSVSQALSGACAGISLSGEGVGGLAELAAGGGLALLHNKHALLRELDYVPPSGLTELPLEDIPAEISKRMI